MSKSVDTLVEDIYHTLVDKKPVGDIDAICDAFGQECAEALKDALSPREDSRGAMRLSALGKPKRMLWKLLNGHVGEPISGPTYIKFLYGHLVEALVLALTKAAGHTVSGQQKEVEVEGVKGHIDGYIDGVLMDVKSASSFGFKKFKNGTLHEDDAFGYIPQLKAYAYAEKQDTYGWLAMDKASGSLAWLQYDEKAPGAYKEAISWDVPTRVIEAKKLVGAESPSVCYPDIPDGKSGNRKLSVGCTFCDFRHQCWPQLQSYQYANGPKFLTHVAREPKVSKIPEGF